MMKIVVDTNIMFTFFWERSFTRGLLLNQNLELVAPVFALEEINEHSAEIIEKTGISEELFVELKTKLGILVEFIPLEEYSKFLNQASSIPDKDDVDFVALALKTGAPVWSNDPHFKKQSLVETFTTGELIKKLEYE
jgi:predicted nucleic acid-binding protein